MMKKTVCLAMVAALALACGGAAGAEKEFFLKDGDRVLFLGDSITQGGGYIADFSAWLYLHKPDLKVELINCGLASETVSGLSEPGHPFPRPCVLDRLERALAEVKPTVVIACYGMNCGIYFPFSQERFDKYKAGIQTILDKAKAANARRVVMTPPPFDAVPIAKRLLPADSKELGFKGPFKDYDSEVLGRYSEWLLTLQSKDVLVIDQHTALNAYVAAKRKDDPKFTLAGDGIHPNALGHALMARTLIAGLGAENADAVLAMQNDPACAKLLKTASERTGVLGLAWLSHVGHKRPGVRKGLPVPQAEAKAADLDKQARAAADEARKQAPAKN